MLWTTRTLRWWNKGQPRPPDERGTLATTRLPSSKLLFMLKFTFVYIACVTFVQTTFAEKTKFHYMQSLCKNVYLQHQYRKIEGAVLWSQNERNLDCFITFQTHSILQRFMLRFDYLQLDCNDHLFIYDGAHAVGGYKADLSCRNTQKSVGSLFTRTNFVTLKYQTDSWGTDSNGFKLVITAVKDPKHSCKDFRCTLREFCISKDLVCDGIDHCADGSDEASTPTCQNSETSRIAGLEKTWFVVVTVCGLLLFCGVLVSIITIWCRKRKRQQNAGRIYGSNGAMKYVGSTSTLTTLPPGSTCPTNTIVKMSGNWVHPAGLSLGYRFNSIQALTVPGSPLLSNNKLNSAMEHALMQGVMQQQTTVIDGMITAQAVDVLQHSTNNGDAHNDTQQPHPQKDEWFV